MFVGYKRYIYRYIYVFYLCCIMLHMFRLLIESLCCAEIAALANSKAFMCLNIIKETPVNYSKPMNKTISYLLTVLYVRTYCYPLNEPDWNLFLNCASKEQREEKKNVNKLKKEMFRAFWNTIFFHFPAFLSVRPLNQKSPLIEYIPSHNLNDGAINGSIAQYID